MTSLPPESRFGAGLTLALAALLFPHAVAGAPELKLDTQIRVVPAIQDEPPCDPDAPAWQPVLLRTVVNTLDTGLTSVFLQRRCGAVLARVPDLEQMRIRSRDQNIITVNGHEFVNLREFPGLSYQIDPTAAVLNIEGEPWIFFPTVIDANQGRDIRLTPPASGAFLNYGAYLLGETGSGSSWAGNLGLGAFNGWGVAVSDWLVLDRPARPMARLNTTFYRDFPEWISGLRIGDVQPRSGGWGSGAPIGGVQYLRNFSTRPGMVITPVRMMDALTARSAILQLSTLNYGDPDARRSPYLYGGLSTVPHGPVELTNLPTYNNGEYELRLRDALGREQTVRQSYFFSEGLLRTGLHDFSYSAGVMRRGFLSDHYDEPGVSATHRYGVNNWLTAQAHFEGTEDNQAVGVSAATAIPWAGVLNTTVATTRGLGARDDAIHYSVALENRYRHFAYALRHEAFDEGFLLPNNPLPRNSAKSRSLISAASRLPWGDSLSLSYSDARSRIQTPVRGIRANYAWRLPANLTVNLFGSWLIDPVDDWSAGLSVHVPLSALVPRLPQRYGPFEARRTRLSVQGTDGQTQDAFLQARVSSTARLGDEHIGLAYSNNLIGNQAQTVSASWVGHTISALAGYTQAEQIDTWTLGASSGLVWISDRLKPTRPIHNSFALIRLGEDNAGVRVNGHAADRRGDVLLSPLQPYYDNPIRINAGDLPPNVRADALEYSINPHFRSGSVLQARLPVIRDALVSIRLEGDDGQLVPLPMGALVFADGRDETFPVGRDGRVYAHGLNDVTTLFVQWRGRRCDLAVLLPDHVPDLTIPEIGPLLCAGVRP